MMGSEEDRDRSRRIGAEDWDDEAHVGYLVPGRSRGRVHRAQGDGERGFLGLASKSRLTFFPVWSQNR
jgi:hypothetical protein